MIHGVYRATPEQVSKWLSPEVMPWILESRPLCVGMYHGECVSIFGAIPTSMICGDSAYIWLWVAPWVNDLPIMLKVTFCRYARDTLRRLLCVYPKLICNCYSEDSAKWLISLGAKPHGKDTYAFYGEKSWQWPVRQLAE